MWGAGSRFLGWRALACSPGPAPCCARCLHLELIKFYPLLPVVPQDGSCRLHFTDEESFWKFPLLSPRGGRGLGNEP